MGHVDPNSDHRGRNLRPGGAVRGGRGGDRGGRHHRHLLARRLQTGGGTAARIGRRRGTSRQQDGKR